MRKYIYHFISDETGSEVLQYAGVVAASVLLVTAVLKLKGSFSKKGNEAIKAIDKIGR